MRSEEKKVQTKFRTVQAQEYGVNAIYSAVCIVAYRALCMYQKYVNKNLHHHHHQSRAEVRHSSLLCLYCFMTPKRED
eukprot:gene8029-5584_t